MELRVVIFGRRTLRREEIIRDLAILRVDYPELKIDSQDLSRAAGLREKPQAVILDCEKDPEDELALAEMRRNGFTGPVVILSPREPSDVIGYLRANVFLYDDTKGTRDLAGIIRRLLVGAVVAARRYPRHRVDETAVLRGEGQWRDVHCRVRNLSKGGAMLESERAVTVRPGSTVKILFMLNGIGRTRLVNARVAWCDKLKFGVEFTIIRKRA